MHQRRKILLASAACALALSLAISPAAVGAPATSTPTPSPEQNVAIELIQPSPAVTPADPLRVDIVTSITAPAEYLEVRVRMFGPSGRLVYQKTEIRSEIPAGRHVIGFEYDLAPINLPPGRYPIEIRVLATGSEPTTQAGRLLIIPAGADALRVALAVQLTDTPAVAADGRFTRDPAVDTRFRDDLAFLTQLALDRRSPLALVTAPVLIEQVARAASGYETVDGTVMSADSEVAGRYARAISDLRSAVSTGAVSLVEVPYALPDLDGLERMSEQDDLAAHWDLADASMAAALGIETASPAAYIGDFPTASGLSATGEQNVEAVLVSPEALRSTDGTTGPGCYTVRGSSLRLLAFDENAARATSAGADAFYDELFDRLGEDDTVVLMLKVGTDAPNIAAEAQRAMDWIADASWLTLVDLGSAMSDAPRPASLGPRPSSSTPPLYWQTVQEARASARAYAAAAGPQDADAASLHRAVLTAESALWAGADGRWAGASQGIELADGVTRFVTERFAAISLDAKDVTLSASRGNVPLALINGTGSPLELTIAASSERIQLPQPEMTITAQPADTLVTIPVDLGAVLADDLRVTVMAGDMAIAETTVRVRASHLDRLVTVGMVVLVLLGLLVFIRRRVRRAIAGTIATDDEPGRG